MSHGFGFDENCCGKKSARKKLLPAKGTLQFYNATIIIQVLLGMDF